MCECRDCDNFKAKKIEPQVGDRVQEDGNYGILVAHRDVKYNYSAGCKEEEVTTLVFFDEDQLGDKDGNNRLCHVAFGDLTLTD